MLAVKLFKYISCNYFFALKIIFVNHSQNFDYWDKDKLNILVTEVDERELIVEIHWFVRDAVRERGSATVHPED